MLIHRMSIIFGISFIYFSVRSAKSELKFEVSPSFRNKHVMEDERGARAIPYRDILAVFDDVQFNTQFYKAE